MSRPGISRINGFALILLALVCLIAVLSGYFASPQPDEGAVAHIFQLSLAAQAPLVLIFVLMSDWKVPLRNVRPLAFQAVMLAIAFGALYHLEHL